MANATTSFTRKWKSCAKTSFTLSRVQREPRGKLIRKSFCQFFARIDLELMYSGHDLSPDIGVHKFFGNFKAFSKNIQLPIAPDKADKGNGSLGDVIQVRKLEFRRRRNRNKPFLLDPLERGLSLKTAVAVVFIVEKLKVLCLGAKISITPKPLGTKEAAVIGIIEALHGSIPPGLSAGDKDDFDA